MTLNITENVSPPFLSCKAGENVNGFSDLFVVKWCVYLYNDALYGYVTEELKNLRITNFSNSTIRKRPVTKTAILNHSELLIGTVPKRC